MQQILKISQNKFFYQLPLEFRVYMYALFLCNIYFYQQILNKSFFTSIILYSVHSPPWHRHNVTYIKHTKSLHLHNLNRTGKVNSNQLYRNFYVTPQQPEIKSKLSKSLNNIKTTYKNFLLINII